MIRIVFIILVVIGILFFGKIRERLGLKTSEPTLTNDEYIPTPPPTLEQDKVVQVSPKAKLLTLLEQFGQSPDEGLQKLVVQGFIDQKTLFGTTLDPGLASSLNLLITNVQQKDPHTFKLLVLLLPYLQGDNKEHLRGILSRGLDSHSILLAEMMGRYGEDKICYVASLVPSDVDNEGKRDFMENRLRGLIAAKNTPGVSALAMTYLEACIKSLQLSMPAPLPEPVAPPEEPTENPEPSP